MRHGWLRSLLCGGPWLLGAVLLPLLSPPGFGIEEPSPKAAARQAPKKKSKAEPEWLSLGAGLLRMREKFAPALVLYAPVSAPAKVEDGKESPGGAGLADELLHPSMRDALRRYVLIRIVDSDLEKPYRAGDGVDGSTGKDAKDAKAKKAKGAPPGEPAPEAPAGSGETVAAKLGLTAGKTSLLVLSFREEVVRRHEGDEVPARAKLKKDLAFVSRVNDIHASAARKVEPEIEASRYAFKLGKTRDAVLKVLPFEAKETRLQMDPVLTKKLDDVFEEYRSKANEALAEGDRLDAERKHEEAIKAFDKAQKDFPFPDVIRQASRRKSEILRKLVSPY